LHPEIGPQFPDGTEDIFKEVIGQAENGGTDGQEAGEIVRKTERLSAGVDAYQKKDGKKMNKHAETANKQADTAVLDRKQIGYA